MTASAVPIDLRASLTQLLATAVADALPGQTEIAVVLERPKQAGHGDYACSIALQLAKPLKRNPREIAQAVLSAVPSSPLLAKAEIAGAGFINLFLTNASKQQVAIDVVKRADTYGFIEFGKNQKINLEFVSANPTGPLHVGHGRSAAFGASLANVLEFAGFAVTREYYVNDAGRQMDILALSTWLRYLEAHDVEIAFPPNAYRGDYVRDMARGILAEQGRRYVRTADEVLAGVSSAEADAEGSLDALIANAKRLLGDDYASIHEYVLTEQLADCGEDLSEFNVPFDRWFSEKSLFDGGDVQRVIEKLAQADQIYSKDGARWFRSSSFGDEKDRVVQRENGQYTYFASDIAYHLNKVERGFDRLIDVLGADHHGYVARVKGALSAMGIDSEKLTVALVQFAILYRDGKKAAMSTRSGEFVTLRQLREEVGNDAARFFYVMRKSDQHLDFDLDLAKSQSNDNPVYYIQYAHARICSVLEQWGEDEAQLPADDLAALDSEQELQLLRQLIDFPAVIEDAARDLAPHTIAFYLKELAGAFHSYYNSSHFLVPEEQLKLARLTLIVAIRQVLKSGLRLLGVSAPAKM
ncbi:MAG: arginine--tRNA ligase [Betaproteobacteria bacterium]